MTYPSLRTIHLVCGAFSVPALLMYGVSAVQMAHSKWFALKPSVSESDLRLGQGYMDGRLMARAAMSGLKGLRGEIGAIQSTPAGFDVRISVPGTVYELRYDRATGATHVRASVAGTLGMLNRLHHAAGLAHEYVPLKLWGGLVAVVSLATLVMGVTGVWMWWLRRQDRIAGLVLLGANLVFATVVLVLVRSAVP